MSPGIKVVFACCALMVAAHTCHVQAQSSSDITVHTLENGLELLLWPDNDIPSVALYNFVRTGSRNEVRGITGLSHFFEHMMFNGTDDLEVGDFDRIMEAAGGSNNAYTSFDLTVYQDWFPASALPTILDLEAERLADLAIVQEVVDSERQVVYSERRSSVDNDNSGQLFEQLFATAFVAHSYGIPILGWPSDIEAWTVEDLQNYFSVYYAPNNLTMVIVGDIDPQQVISMVEARFAALPAKSKPPKVRTKEPEQRGERRLQVTGEVVSPLLQVAYKSPQASDPISPAYDLLLDILTDGDSSRLHRLMVEQKRVVVSVDVYRHEGFDPSITVFFMTLPEGAGIAAAEKVFYDELENIATHGVSERELQKVKNLTEARYWDLMSTINGKANALGTYHVLHGDYAQLFDVPKRYAGVTREQIRKAAAQIFVADHRTVAFMENTTTDDKAPAENAK